MRLFLLSFHLSLLTPTFSCFSAIDVLHILSSSDAITPSIPSHSKHCQMIYLVKEQIIKTKEAISRRKSDD